MKSSFAHRLKVTAFAISAAAFAPAMFAQLNVPYADGSDGALIVSNTTTIDLSQAVAGNWTNNNTANSGKGIYDSNQWAVVFKYSSVVISNGATLSFSNHPTHAPVVWLVSNNVAINGTLNLDGKAGTSSQVLLAEPGPGGFRGGGAPTALYGPGPGFGPGGANPTSQGHYSGVYGNQQLIPLIGGSGGSGLANTGLGGSGGGGAILIATMGAITNNGYIHANGGADPGHSPYGSGGGIRLVASQIAGSGTIEAISVYDASAIGIIRLEATNVSPNLTISPYIQGVAPSNAPTIFPTAPASVTISSISNQTVNVSAPADPKAVMSADAGADDFTLVTTNTVTIRLRTQNFPTNGTVTVFIRPRNGPQSSPGATCIGGDFNSADWQVGNVTVPVSIHTIIQARAAY